MHPLTDYFKMLRSRIEPEDDRLVTAQDMPQRVRDHLQEHTTFLTVSPYTRLVGSYGRYTAIKRIKDVDILVFVPDDSPDNGIPALLKGLEDALRELPDELDDCGEVTLRKQRRSVNVVLEQHELSLDIVPVRTTGDGINGRLEVPDREWERWVGTQPLGYGPFLSTLNAEHDGKVVPLVKLFKHWRDQNFATRRPKSYWLESLVVQHIRRGWVSSAGKGYALLIAETLRSIHDRFTPVLEEDGMTPWIPDAMLTNNVAWNWERTHFETFMRRLDEAVRWAEEAVETEEKELAVSLWRRIFGDAWFPSTEDVEAEYRQLGRLSGAGKLLVAPTGLVAASLPAFPRSIPAPATRFHGNR